MSYSKSVPRLLLACYILCGISASAQVIPVNSQSAAKHVPSFTKLSLHNESHLNDCSLVLSTYKKGLITFDSALETLLGHFGINKIDAIFSEYINIPSGDSTLIKLGCHSDNQWGARLSVVSGRMGIIALKEAFSLPVIQSALLSWNGNKNLLLIEGGEAWQIQQRMSHSHPVDNETWGDTSHLTDIFWDTQVICTKETNQNSNIRREEVSCLVPLDSSVRADFPTPQFEQRQQQQQQQRQQQQERQFEQQQHQEQQRQQQTRLPAFPTPLSLEEQKMQSAQQKHQQEEQAAQERQQAEQWRAHLNHE